MTTRKQIMIILAGFLLISLLASCNKSTTTDLPTKTSEAPTGVVSTKTPTVAKTTGTPTSTPVDLSGLALGTPVPQWKEIPLMPGAISGKENSDNSSYLYAINIVPSEIATFYTQELVKLGWEPKSGNATPAPGGVLTLVFYKGQEACIVSIIQQPDGALVMLGRQPK